MPRTVDPYDEFFDPDHEVPPDGYSWAGPAHIPVDRLQACPLDYGRPE